ncbi:hypothetical protein BN1723_016452, partial [Verticillium longisporum]
MTGAGLPPPPPQPQSQSQSQSQPQQHHPQDRRASSSPGDTSVASVYSAMEQRTGRGTGPDDAPATAPTTTTTAAAGPEAGDSSRALIGGPGDARESRRARLSELAIETPPLGPLAGDAGREFLCLCTPAPKVPRPRNAFILYRQHHQAQVVSEHPGLANPDISKIIGEQWRQQPDNAQEAELRDQIKALESDLQDYSTVQEQFAASKEKLAQSESAVEDLRQQLDNALGAEDMIEDLTERNMSMAEEIEELKAVIEDLENLKEINDELEINHVQNEKEMQEELDFKDSSRAMMDLNMKLQISAAKTQVKTIDLELRRLEAQEAEQHLEIVKLFLPETYQEDRDSVLALLRFKRLAFKATLLQGFLKERVTGQPHPGHEDDMFAGCDAIDKLTWVAAILSVSLRFLMLSSATGITAMGASRPRGPGFHTAAAAAALVRLLAPRALAAAILPASGVVICGGDVAERVTAAHDAGNVGAAGAMTRAAAGSGAAGAAGAALVTGGTVIVASACVCNCSCCPGPKAKEAL